MTLLELPTPPSLGSIPVLETERLVLRAPRLEDAKAIAALANHRRIAENTRRIPHPYSSAHAEEFVAAQDANETAFVITAGADIVGACGLSVHAKEPAEIGYWLGVDHWRKGYATEAVRALVDYAFTDCSHATLQAGARVTNPGSRRVLEKCGFQWIGVGLCRSRALSSSVPIDQFRLDRALWQSLKSWGAVKRHS